MSDFKIFLKYVFNVRGFIEGVTKNIKTVLEAKNLSIVFIIFAVFFLFKLPRPKNGYVAIIFLVVALLMQLRVKYLAGEHRHWHRKKIGMKTKKELLKQEWDVNKGEQDPKLNVEEEDGRR